jgi:hypothetical protein
LGINFPKNFPTSKDEKGVQDTINSNGIPTSKYKKFLKEWREKNLI